MAIITDFKQGDLRTIISEQEAYVGRDLYVSTVKEKDIRKMFFKQTFWAILTLFIVVGLLPFTIINSAVGYDFAPVWLNIISTIVLIAAGTFYAANFIMQKMAYNEKDRQNLRFINRSFQRLFNRELRVVEYGKNGKNSNFFSKIAAMITVKFYGNDYVYCADGKSKIHLVNYLNSLTTSEIVNIVENVREERKLQNKINELQKLVNSERGMESLKKDLALKIKTLQSSSQEYTKFNIELAEKVYNYSETMADNEINQKIISELSAA